MADSYIQIGSTGTKKKIVDLGDGTYGDAVVVLGSDGGGQIAADELVLAAATGSEGGLGKISANSLEQSNVDLATEFVKMIIAQRGYQANSRVITTTDEVLQELMNIKR